jgi:hypothetical protein
MAVLTTDNFSTDTIASGLWSADTGSGFAINGGVLTMSGTTTELLKRTNVGQPIDHLASIQFTTGASLTSVFGFGFMLKEIDTTDYLFVRISGSGTASWQLQVYAVVSGTASQLTYTSYTLLADTIYTLQSSIVGNIVTATLMDVNSNVLATKAATLSGTNATTYGANIAGNVGLRKSATSSSGFSDWSLDNYSLSNYFPSIAAPSRPEFGSMHPSVLQRNQPMAMPKVRAAPATLQLLPYAPPAGYESFTSVYITNTNNSVTLDTNTDYLIVFPSTPITATGGVQINGGRNVVIIGGEINIPVQWITTGTYPYQYPSKYPEQTITTVNGVSQFYLTNGPQDSGCDETSAISSTATAAQVQAALNALPSLATTASALSTGLPSIYEVTGPAGGPWVVIGYAPNFSLRRLTAVGADVVYSSSTWTSARGMNCLEQTGVLHIEGLRIGGPGCEEGLDFYGSPDTDVQIQNCEINALRHDWNLDHFHGDCIQAAGGPMRLRMYNVGMKGRYQCMTVQPTADLQPPTLEQWEFHCCSFYCSNDPNDVPPAATSTEGSQGVGYTFWYAKPASTYLTWPVAICDRVYVGAPLTDRPASELFYFNGYNNNVPYDTMDVRFNKQPPPDLWEPFKYGLCGAGYVSPGYQAGSNPVYY